MTLQMLIILQRLQVIKSKVNDTAMSLMDKGLELQSFQSMKINPEERELLFVIKVCFSLSKQQVNRNPSITAEERTL